MKALLASLWQQNLPALRTRVDALDQAASEAATGALTPETRAQASDFAHKLAGSLGMFGFPRGTEIAREIEQALEIDAAPDAASLLRLCAELRSLLPL